MPPHTGEIQIKQDDIRARGGLSFPVGAFAMQIRQGFIPITHNAQVVEQTGLLEGALGQAHIPGIIFNQQHG
jgi:hypothetical protein